MKKEIIICIVVVTFIIALDIFFEKNTNKVMDEILENLEKIKIGLINENEETIKKDIENVMEKWEKEKNKLSIYIEHDELEKVEMYIVEVKTDIETDEYNMAMQSLSTCEFIIEHIKDKYKLSLKNIF